MSQDLPMKSESDNCDRAKSLVVPKTPIGIIDQLKKQLERSEESNRRIVEEGIVVRDMKGSVIPHPAIKIENDACKIITDLLKKYGRTNVKEEF